MEREEIRRLLFGDEALPLWVPLLTHYREAGEAAAVDAERTALHAAEVMKHSKLWIVADSTGDGWEVSDEQFDALVSFTLRPEFRGEGVRAFIGVLRPTTIEVRALVDRVHHATGTSPGATLESNVRRLAASGLAGIAVCPPVGAGVTQEEIVLHYRDICGAARMPVAVHQLPQVVRNEIVPGTMARLVAEHEGIVVFRDSSGDDEIARSSGAAEGVVLLRGAEGRYAEALKVLGGPYDGLLPGTANCLGGRLREMLRLAEAGDAREARALSAELSEFVERLLTAGAGAPVGRVSANVNRAADHCLAYGRAFHEFPSPLLFDGSRLPERVLADVAAVLDDAGLIREPGYLAAAGA